MNYALILNPGSTSTKVGVFEGRNEVFTKTIRHSQFELSEFSSVVEQKSYRKEMILGALRDEGFGPERLCGIISIGGLIRPGDAGVYEINEQMIDDLMQAKYDEHASNLGAIIAWEMSNELNIPAYVADAITADEMQDVARLSGLPDIPRNGRSHTLNQKSTAAKAAQIIGRSYENCNFVVAHLGGGISVTAHRRGKMIDTNNARGEGPFCMDRAGGVNSFELVKLCFSGKYTKEEMIKKLNGNGGVVAYLGTRDFKEVCDRMNDGDEGSRYVFDALAYQVSKEIGAMCVALEGDIDAIVLTGGMANSQELTDSITKQVAFLGRVLVFPGESEFEALAAYIEEVRTGDRTPLVY